MRKNGTGQKEGCVYPRVWKSAIVFGLALLWAVAGVAVPPPSSTARVNVPAGGFGIDGDLSPETGTPAIGDWVGPNGRAY